MPFHNLLATLREETMLSQKPAPTSTEVLGWTVGDGPWMYRLIAPSEAPGDWLELSDEIEYQRVLQSLRQGALVLMHVSLHKPSWWRTTRVTTKQHPES
mgnify:CR=1 FL=1